MTAHVNDDSFKSTVLESKIPVMVDFFAEWCGPCKALAPVVDELSGEYDGKVMIVKLNVDEAQNTAQEFGIMSIPTLVFFKDGTVVDKLTGAQPKSVLEEKLDALVA